MNQKQIGTLACKILSIYALIEAAKMLQAATSTLSAPIPTESKLSFALATFLPFLFLVAVAAALWSWAKPLGELMVEEESQENEKREISNTEIQVIAFSIIGLYILIKGIPVIAGDVANFYLVFQNTQINGGLMTPHKLRIVIDVLQLLLGIGLMLGSRGLVGMIQSLRTAGAQEKDKD